MKVAIILKAPELNCSVEEKYIIYADAGYKYKERFADKTVLGVVGDFDSLKFVPKDEKIISLKVEKNYTDGERSVLYAKECGAKEIVIYGAFGGKMEHVLGNLALLKIAQNLNLLAKIKDGEVVTELIEGKKTIRVKKGCAVSLIPYGGNCEFKESKNLYYPLNELTLTPADTRGISNLAQSEEIFLHIKKGQALIFYSV